MSNGIILYLNPGCIYLLLKLIYYINYYLSRGATLMGLHDEIFNALSEELLEKVAHFGAGDIKALKENSEELVQAFQKKISKTYGIFFCASDG